MMHFGKYHIYSTIPKYHKTACAIGEKQYIVILIVLLQARLLMHKVCFNHMKNIKSVCKQHYQHIYYLGIQ